MTTKPEPASELRSACAPDGARLEYEVIGSGPPLAMLHGFLSGRSAFSRQRGLLSKHFRLIIPSARGHDGSDGMIPSNYGAGDSDVDDLNVILDAERIGRLSLFGHSSGGATAFVFACRHPERMDRAVLIEPTLYGLLPRAEYDEVAGELEPIIALAGTGGPGAALRAAMAAIGGEAWNNLKPERKASRLASLATRAPLVGPHFRGLLDLPVADADVSKFRPPALLFYGPGSFPFEASIATRFRALRPDFPVVTVEGAGHNVHRDKPDIVNPAALAFLS
jgi:pimeloyl-ACP methyl ester carboxylesterase